MKRFLIRMSLGTAALLMLAASGGFAVDSGVDILANRTYVHRDSKTALRVSAGWNVSEPFRLRKTTTTSILSIDKADPRISVTVVWTPLDKKTEWNKVIRAAEDEDLGAEYGVLLAVYGKAKVSRPTTIRSGPFTVFKVLIDDGPEGPSKSAGAVYLFEAGSGENRWKVKVRAVFPQLNRDDSIRQVEALIDQFGNAQ